MVKYKAQSLKFLVLSFSFAFLAFSFRLPCFAQDKIVAIVNDDVITQKDLNDFINILRIQLSEELQGKELEAKIQSLGSDLLNRLIEDRLILQEAKKEKVQINEAVIKEKIAEIKKKYPSEEDFNYDLAKQGLVQADLEAKIRDQHLMRSIVDRKVRSRVVISPNEIADFYERSKEKFILPVQRELEVVGFKDKSLAQEAYDDIEAGKSWEDVVKNRLLNTDNILVAQDGQLRKDVEDALFKLNIDEVTAPLKVEETYYIFRLNNIIPSRQQTLAEAQGAIRNFLGNEKMQKELSKWLDEIKKQTYIKIL